MEIDVLRLGEKVRLIGRACNACNELPENRPTDEFGIVKQAKLPVTATLMIHRHSDRSP